MLNLKPTHQFLETIKSINGELLIGGLKVTQIAERVGRTPFYVYDKQIISNQVRRLRKALPPQLEIHYAIKANPMPGIVNHLSNIIDGLDVASKKEMQIALDSGMAPQKISFAGPGKSDTEIKSAVMSGIVLNIESLRELKLAIEYAKQLNVEPKIALRVNPDFELKGSGMKMSGGPKQFGIDAEEIPSFIEILQIQHVPLYGFHIFTGSQNLKAEAIIEAQKKSIELGIRLAKESNIKIKTVNIGGGFGVTYFAGEQPLNIELIGQELKKNMKQLETELPETTLQIELGRYLVAEAGYYICKVVDKKISRGQTFLIADGGLHHHLAASGNFGQIIRKNYPVAIANKINQKETESVNVVGKLCTPLDLLADKIDLPIAEPNDLFVIFMSGAYGKTASPQEFLSHEPPNEIIV